MTERIVDRRTFLRAGGVAVGLVAGRRLVPPIVLGEGVQVGPSVEVNYQVGETSVRITVGSEVLNIQGMRETVTGVCRDASIQIGGICETGKGFKKSGPGSSRA